METFGSSPEDPNVQLVQRGCWCDV
ncbi:MAG: hypothetical protein QOE36_2971, partial [Gaiellaceae bacterium]|nr:hypothetical protein [Gaiellaceae bacterium]